jgi:predicted DsbA family dithiol-disulfide isomerase
MASVRLKAVLPEFQGQLLIRWRAFPLQVIDSTPAPRHIIDQEWPHVASEEPLAAFRPWHTWGYPYSTYLAHEAYGCAFAQDPVRAFDFDFRIRRALYYESRWIQLRNVLIEIAAEAGLDLDRFTDDFDSGCYKAQIMQDCREALRMRDEEGRPMTSPTLVLPNGEVYHNPFATRHVFDPQGKMVILVPPERTGEAALEGYREILRRALG